MRRPMVIAVILSSLAGCGAPKMEPIGMPFYVEENQRCVGQGTGQIMGQAFLRTMGGEVRYAAGGQVVLWPDSAYSRKAASMLVSGITPQPEGKLTPYERRTQADGEGEFEFADLPACSYVVLTSVFWSVPDNGTQGGWLGSIVRVEEGKRVKVILTR